MKICLLGMMFALAASPLVASAQAFLSVPQPLTAAGQGEDCFPRKVFDRKSGENVTISIARGCPGGYIKAENTVTGRKWRVDIQPGGWMAGVDEDGVRWSYNPRTRLFVNLSTRASCSRPNVRHVCQVQPS
ncbi:MAG: hypothetical protein WA840_22630 [Caulobacteraceae bacterium]